MLVEFRTDPLRVGPEWMRLYPILEEANMVCTHVVNTTMQQFGEPPCSIRAMLDFFVDVDVSYIRLIMPYGGNLGDDSNSSIRF